MVQQTTDVGRQAGIQIRSFSLPTSIAGMNTPNPREKDDTDGHGCLYVFFTETDDV